MIASLRRTARLIVIDSAGDLLLVRYDDSRPKHSPYYWATPGGGLEANESFRDAAARELREETGLVATIGRELWERRALIENPSGMVDQTERFFLVNLRERAPSVHNSSPEAIVAQRWWKRADLASTADIVYPEGLAARLDEILLDAGRSGR